MDARDQFAPLSPDEMTAAWTTTGRANEEAAIVGPVPVDAPTLDVRFKGRTPDEVLWFLNAKGERLFAECRWILDGGGKEVRPVCYVGHRWQLRAYPPPRSLYNLDKFAASIGPMWMFEGPRKADKAGACFPGAVTTALAGGANAINQTDLSPLRRRHVILWRDGDETGARWQEQMIPALRAVNVASVRVVNIDVLPLEMIERIPEAKRGRFDIADLIEAAIEPEAIRAGAEAACEPAAISSAATTRTPVGDSLTGVEIDAEIERLSVLSLVAFERERTDAAQRLGVRATILDGLVKARRKKTETANGQGQPLDLPTPEPWPDSVDGAALLSDMTATIRKYAVMEAGSAETVALWICHAHAHEASEISPRLAATAPEKGCGKTTLLEVNSIRDAAPAIDVERDRRSNLSHYRGRAADAANRRSRHVPHWQ